MECDGIVGNGLRKNLLSCQSPLYFHFYLKFSKKNTYGIFADHKSGYFFFLKPVFFFEFVPF